MKILIVGHINRIRLIEEVMLRYYQNVDFENLEYTSISQTDDICEEIEKRQMGFDALFFTGEIPYRKIVSHMIPAVTCGYLIKDKVSLLTILLKIMRNNKYDIRKVSFDSYGEKSIREVYSEIGYESEDISLLFDESKITEAASIDYVKDFHQSSYESGQVSCCVTALNNVYERLKEQSIPCYILNPSTDIIKHSIERLMLKHMATINEDARIVVIAIHIDYPHEYSIANSDEYQSFRIRTKVSEKIYSFVQRIQAAVVHESGNRFIMFSTKAFLESETNNYRSIELLHNISKEYASNISIGIGHGITAREAKYNAILAMNKSMSHGHNAAYVIYEGDRIVGPIMQSMSRENTQIVRDDKFGTISMDTGISIKKLFTIHSMKDKYQKNAFTSKELSEELKLSIRSINKILRKLEDNHLIEVIGNKYDGHSGRPSRLVKILF